MSSSPQVLDGLLGVCVGDALGVPVEFKNRAVLAQDPVIDMIGYKVHNQPPGTWSDDSSLTFCLAESLINGFDLEDQGKKFSQWAFENYWTPHGSVFDIGMTTREAIFKLKGQKCPPMEAGGKGPQSNGNGSLMRILPLAYYLHYKGGSLELVQQASCLTHAHLRSQLGCAIYIQFILSFFETQSIAEAFEDMKQKILSMYSHEKKELSHYDLILKEDIVNTPEKTIRSEGYVVYTLEASFWCLLKSSSYQETVLKAVNLGKDTDTTGGSGWRTGWYLLWNFWDSGSLDSTNCQKGRNF